MAQLTGGALEARRKRNLEEARRSGDQSRIAKIEAKLRPTQGKKLTGGGTALEARRRRNLGRAVVEQDFGKIQELSRKLGEAPPPRLGQPGGADVPTSVEAVGSFGKQGVIGFDRNGAPIIGNVGAGTADLTDPEGGIGLTGGQSFLPDDPGAIDLSQFDEDLVNFARSIASRVSNKEGPAAIIEAIELIRTGVLGDAPAVGEGLGDPGIEIGDTELGGAPELGVGGELQVDASTQALLESLGITQGAFAGRAELGEDITEGLQEFISTGEVPPAFQNTLGAGFDDIALAGEAGREAILARTGARGSQLDREIAASFRQEGTEASRFRADQNKELFDLAANLGLTAPEVFGQEIRSTADALRNAGELGFKRDAFQADLQGQFALTEFQGTLKQNIAQGQLDQGTFFKLVDDFTARDLADLDQESIFRLNQFAADEARDLREFDQGNLNARQQAELQDRQQTRQLQREELKADVRLAERQLEIGQAEFRQGLRTQAETFNLELNLRNAIAKGQLFNAWATAIEQIRAGERTADKQAGSALASAFGSLVGTAGTAAAIFASGGAAAPAALAVGP